MAEIPIRPNIAICYPLRQAAEGPEILLLKRAKFPAGTWCHISGGIEKGETAWQCALRELGEETGLVPERFYSAEILESFYEAGRDQITIGIVFVAYIGSDCQVEINEEHTDFGWFSIEDAIEKVEFAQQRKILRHIDANFLKRTPSKFNAVEI